MTLYKEKFAQDCKRGSDTTQDRHKVFLRNACSGITEDDERVMIDEICRFSTTGDTPTDSVEAWRQYLESIYYPHHVGATASNFIHGYLEKRSFLDIVVSRHSATDHSIARSKELIARDKTDRYAFIFPRAGAFRCKQGVNEGLFRSREMYVIKSAEPFMVETHDNASSICLTLPADLCDIAVKGMSDRLCKADVAESILIESLVGLSNGVFESTRQVDALWLRDICCDLLDAMFNPRYSADARQSWRMSDAARSIIIDAVRLAIQQRLHASTFTVVEAAMTCGVSVRHLQATLQAVGSSFRGELREARLQRAAAILRSAERGNRQLGQIALACGFPSQAHFSSSYKARFGVSPKDER